MAPDRRFFSGLVVGIGLFLAGCGGTGSGANEPERYRLEPTRDCLEQAAARVTTEGLDFVASTALGGGLGVKLSENELTIAFGQSRADAVRTEQAYRQFAGEAIPIDDVLFRRLNVVMLWELPPTDKDRAIVLNCLEG
ncbi:MAG: hypothetical protein M3168_02105 [Actinomycetota bacterium]|nr:hypothetical protein [Actinomycetota bacterium]